MDIIERLRAHYENNPPRLSYGGSEGESVRGKTYPKWPEGEESKELGGVVVWRKDIPAFPNVQPPDGYCIVDSCLDLTGRKNPDALPLFPEMKGHALRVAVYVDMFNRIHMKAVGGFTVRGKRKMPES